MRNVIIKNGQTSDGRELQRGDIVLGLSDDDAARLTQGGGAEEFSAGKAILLTTPEKAAAFDALVSGDWNACPHTLDASVNYATIGYKLTVAASQTVTLALSGVAALPRYGITLDVAKGGAGATLAFSGGALHDDLSTSISLSAGYTYTVRPSGTAGVVYVTGGARL